MGQQVLKVNYSFQADLVHTRLTLSHSGLRHSCDNVISCDKSPCLTTNPATIDKCTLKVLLVTNTGSIWIHGNYHSRTYYKSIIFMRSQHHLEHSIHHMTTMTLPDLSKGWLVYRYLQNCTIVVIIIKH